MSEVPLVQKNFKTVIGGVKLEGTYYFKYCPGDVIKHVAWCCNLFFFDKQGEHIHDIEPSFLKVADPSNPVKKKRNILMNRQVGNGIFSVLANVILPLLGGLLVTERN